MLVKALIVGRPEDCIWTQGNELRPTCCKAGDVQFFFPAPT